MEIIFQHVTSHYRILHDINLTIPLGQIVAVCGHTGSGKSTLLKHMNGLMIPGKGIIKIGNFVIKPGQPQKSLKALRKHIGMVFQFPESQLFAETVAEDISFAPIQFGFSKKEAFKLTKAVMTEVGLSHELLSKSPFSLSGGQKRLVAIAGVLVTGPDVLLLDEPAAGLDPIAHQKIMNLLADWHKKRNMTMIFITHDMDDAARYADEMVIMKNGEIAYKGKTREVFSNEQLLKETSLSYPSALKFQRLLEEHSGHPLPINCLTAGELAEQLILYRNKHR
ncbi:energy-coupling factor transporter ATPase [Bacillaceae bacterium Marseille-Q3522]|nr:energy-coupling factor transporter ATPase [Bacillaceae bacterium Marseille-Q3522]